MNSKSDRLEVIKMILSNQEISNQEDLLIELDKVGFSLTQATLSRDLKQLKVAKATNAYGEYVYVLPDNGLYRRVPDSRSLSMGFTKMGVQTVKFSGNLAVLQTLPGHAGQVAYNIDKEKIEEFIGTIAGDDTIILVLAEGVDRETALARLAEVVPDI